MTTDQLLQHRHEIFLEWNEPWPATGADLKQTDAHVVLRATVQDCINLERRSWAARSEKRFCGTEGNLLEEFMAIHWATVLNPLVQPDPDPYLQTR